MHPPRPANTPPYLPRAWEARREIVAVAVVAAILSLTGITWGIPNADNDWAIDSIAPLGPLAYAESMLYGGHWWSKYPPLHFTILALLYAPYVGFLLATGTFESWVTPPYGLGDGDVSLPLLTLLARTVSAAMAVGAAVVACLIGRELGGRRAGLFAGLFFAASPLTVYYGHTANLDMPYVFWSSLALLFLVRVARGAATPAFVGLGVATAAAVATKDQAYGLFLLLPLPLWVLAARAEGRKLPRRLLAGAGAALVTYLLAANVVIDLRGWIEHLRFITHEGSRPYRMFTRDAEGYGRLAVSTLELIRASMTLPVVLLGAGGLVWAAARRLPGAGLLLLATGSYLVLFLGPILYVLPRFVLPAVLVLAVFAGVAAARVWRVGHALPRLLVAGAVVHALAYGASINLGFLRDSRYAAEQWIAYNLPPDALVGTNGERTYLPRLPPHVRTVHVDITPAGVTARGRLPEYLVLSEAHYRRYLRHEAPRRALEALVAGKLNYVPAAEFRQHRLRALALIPGLSPRILILRRRDATAEARVPSTAALAFRGCESIPGPSRAKSAEQRKEQPAGIPEKVFRGVATLRSDSDLKPGDGRGLIHSLSGLRGRPGAGHRRRAPAVERVMQIAGDRDGADGGEVAGAHPTAARADEAEDVPQVVGERLLALGVLGAPQRLPRRHPQ